MSGAGEPTADELWDTVCKEINGIQLLWVALEGMYFNVVSHPGIEALERDTPTLYRLMQTAMMESLLMRIARLMDPVSSGRGKDAKPNLSLARLVVVKANLASGLDPVKKRWDESMLGAVRRKYLSHNDLHRAQSEAHTLTIPLSLAEVSAVGVMVAALREFRAAANPVIRQAAYVEFGLDLQMSRECEILNRTLQAGHEFFNNLSEQGCLRNAPNGNPADVELNPVSRQP